ncbi:MAG: hypothetical protein IJ514_04525 [Clostridia bacterium]|nr:hypothetical protein [Clostridia bacterium]
MLHFQTPCDVVVLAGQSNAQGYGTGEVSEPYEADERVLILGNRIPTYKHDGEGKEYLEVFEPWEYNIRVATLGERGCFGLYFAREYIKKGLLKEGRKLLIVYAAVGGTGFGDRAWGTNAASHYSGYWTQDGPLYRRMLEMIDDALALNPENELVAFLWHQGESEAWNNIDGDELAAKNLREKYYGYLSTLLDAVRARYGAPKLPIVAAKFVNEWERSNETACESVYQATERAIAERGGAYLETADLPSNNQVTGNGDELHFSHEALRLLGARYCAAYEKLLAER